MTEPLSTSPVSSNALQREGEFELLCALAGANLAPKRLGRIANWNLPALDWSELLRLAEHHGVLPLAARNLIEHARGLPPEVERSLRSAYEANLRRSLWFTAELARIMQHFEQAVAGGPVQRAGAGAIAIPRSRPAKLFGSRLPDFFRGLRASKASSCRNRISPFRGSYPGRRAIVAADRLRTLV